MHTLPRSIGDRWQVVDHAWCWRGAREVSENCFVLLNFPLWHTARATHPRDGHALPRIRPIHTAVASHTTQIPPIPFMPAQGRAAPWLTFCGCPQTCGARKTTPVRTASNRRNALSQQATAAMRSLNKHNNTLHSPGKGGSRVCGLLGGWVAAHSLRLFSAPSIFACERSTRSSANACSCPPTSRYS